MSYETDLLGRVRSLVKHGYTTRTRFGRKTLNDPRLIMDLEAGRTLREKARVKVEKYLKPMEDQLYASRRRLLPPASK